MVTKEVKDVYHRMLSAPADSPTAVELRRQVMNSIHVFLNEEDAKMMTSEAKCKYQTFSLKFLPFLWLPTFFTAGSNIF